MDGIVSISDFITKASVNLGMDSFDVLQTIHSSSVTVCVVSCSSNITGTSLLSSDSSSPCVSSRDIASAAWFFMQYLFTTSNYSSCILRRVFQPRPPYKGSTSSLHGLYGFLNSIPIPKVSVLTLPRSQRGTHSVSFHNPFSALFSDLRQ